MKTLYLTGCAVAAVFSVIVNGSTVWAIAHGIASWLYVLHLLAFGTQGG